MVSYRLLHPFSLRLFLLLFLFAPFRRNGVLLFDCFTFYLSMIDFCFIGC
jgi:hypothetical protein